MIGMTMSSRQFVIAGLLSPRYIARATSGMPRGEHLEVIATQRPRSPERKLRRDHTRRTTMKKQNKQNKANKQLGVRREVVRFLGSDAANVAGGYCGTTGGQCGCTATGCTNSWMISY
jgi:hypothetical protein